MSEQRLYFGIALMVQANEVNVEKFVGWFDSEDHARGAWVPIAFRNNRGARLDNMSVDDITDVARIPA